MSFGRVDSKYQAYDPKSLQRDFEDKILNYKGDDPIEPWLHYITYLEQCLKSKATGENDIKEKLKVVISRCFALLSVMESYRNDERLVGVFIKMVQQSPAERQVGMLQKMLERGFGEKTSLIYLNIAAVVEIEEGPSKAMAVLEAGVKAHAQPINLLVDALTDIKNRMAKTLPNVSNNTRVALVPENQRVRVSSIKTANKNVDCSPFPLGKDINEVLKERQQTKEVDKSVSLSNMRDSMSSVVNSSNTVCKTMYKKDELKLGTCNEITFDHLRAQKYLAMRGLNVPSDICKEEKRNEAAKQLARIKKDLVIESEVLAKEREIDSLKKALRECEDRVAQLMEKQKKDDDILKQNHMTIVKLEEAIREIKTTSEQTAEHLQFQLKQLEKRNSISVNEVGQAEQDNIELQILLKQEKENVDALLREKEELIKNFEEEKLKMQQNFDRERNESLLNFSQKLEQSLARQEIEQGLGLGNDSKRNITNSNSFVIRQQQPFERNSAVCRTPAPKLPFTLYESNFEMTEIEEYSLNMPQATKSLASFSQSQTTDVVQQEDQASFIINDENAIPLNRNFSPEVENPPVEHFAMPAPRPRVSITSAAKQVKNNFWNPQAEKQIRNENIFQPPPPPPPSLASEAANNSMDLEDEDEIILKGQEETGMDFNVSDLTTALKFGRPLVYSTPEKVPLHLKPTSLTSFPPPAVKEQSENSERYIPVKRLTENRKSKLFRGLSAPPPPPPPVPLFFQQDNRQQETELQPPPIIYDDEEARCEDKENYDRTNFDQPGSMPYNLSPISETSKERWSSGSHSGSSNNTT